MRYVPIAALLLCMGAAVGCGPDVPAQPTWEADVKPIILARCVRCHNGNFGDPEYLSGSSGVDFRYPSFAMIPAMYYTPGQGTSWDDAVHGRSELAGIRMPPPPMAALEDWQLQTFINWTKKPQ